MQYGVPGLQETFTTSPLIVTSPDRATGKANAGALKKTATETERTIDKLDILPHFVWCDAPKLFDRLRPPRAINPLEQGLATACTLRTIKTSRKL